MMYINVTGNNDIVCKSVSFLSLCFWKLQIKSFTEQTRCSFSVLGGKLGITELPVSDELLSRLTGSDDVVIAELDGLFT